MSDLIFNWKGDRFVSDVLKRVERNLDRAAFSLENYIKGSFQAGPEPSFPGETPAIQTGRLLASITSQKGGRFTRLVGSSLKPQRGFPSYAFMLEFGTFSDAGFARPYLRPALANPVVRSRLKKIIEKVGK